MAELFSEEWMKSFAEKWNADPELGGALEKIGFNSVIAYGFDGEDKPRGYLKVENGKVVEAGTYTDQELNWDLRATPEQWQKWLSKPPGMMALGMAYTSRKLKFNVGDYASMIKDPRMAGPFIHSFAVMAQA
ncbi:MAG: SCP-2 sterol transfer family protein [Gammaproteobacteria bacterium]|nr:MAG: SCP-2 sterol transfer family protein [Gammaproteobacteria bacterium]